MSFDEHKTPVANGDPDPVTPLEERNCDPGAALSHPAGRASVVETPEAEESQQPLVPPEKRTLSTRSGGRQQVHVAADLHDLITGVPITPEDVEKFRRRHLLNQVIHRLLTLGLAASTAAMLAGLVLDAVSRHEISHQVVPQFRAVVRSALSMDGSGFLALGLLLLIATPILRVLGSFFSFVYEHDWGYAGITLVVLAILFVSLMFGRA